METNTEKKRFLTEKKELQEDIADSAKLAKEKVEKYRR